MRHSAHTSQAWLWPTLVAIVALPSSPALAGGFEVQQSAYFQGMSFAGAAAGGPSLASISWNPAASAFAAWGLSTESSYAGVFPEANLTVLNPEVQPPPPGTDKVDVGRNSLVGASYNTLRASDRTVLALTITAPFGLVTKPDDVNWAGKYEAVTTKIFSINATPSVSYEVVPGLALGIGVQFQYFDLLELRAATPAGGSNVSGDNVGTGVVAGVNFSPNPGTSIGLGFRSSIDHTLRGDFRLRFNPDTAKLVGSRVFETPAEAEIDLPDKLTFSFRQAVSPRARLLGTVDWTNWSRFGVVPIRLGGPFPPLEAGDAVANIVFNWQDGWMFALGGEFDWSPRLTLRTGVGYEISPVDGPTTRLVQVPDSNHTWVSAGATYRWSENFSFDLAYSHGFFEDDAPFERLPAAVQLQSLPPLIGTADVSADVVSVGWRWRFGGAPPAPQPLK
ncbi:MAG TPA: outer membrane protein transport protein [Methyloceanibacter sp.]|nr:outer membrane protein transport protein [Methyloceanibacter sp.]